jgi:hypothetical protein
MGSVLEKISAHTRELGDRGIGHDELIETCARILHQVVAGDTSRS